MAIPSREDFSTYVAYLRAWEKATRRWADPIAEDTYKIAEQIESMHPNASISITWPREIYVTLWPRKIRIFQNCDGQYVANRYQAAHGNAAEGQCGGSIAAFHGAWGYDDKDPVPWEDAMKWLSEVVRQ